MRTNNSTKKEQSPRRIRFSDDLESNLNNKIENNGKNDNEYLNEGIFERFLNLLFDKSSLIFLLISGLFYALILYIYAFLFIIRFLNQIYGSTINLLFKNKGQNSVNQSSNYKYEDSDSTILVLHPNAINNGGGEKVLWHILSNIPSSKYNIKIFSSDSELKQNQWRTLISNYFGIQTIQIRRLEFVNVKKTHDLIQKASKKPFTLLLQSIISMIGFSFSLFFNSKQGDILLDTTGFPFVYPLAYAMGLKVVAYVHYPTISTDMFNRVKQKRNMYNNNSGNSNLKTYAKLIYYRAFALAYGLVGSYCEIAAVNSSWTFGHIIKLWNSNYTKIHTVYPPVNVSNLKKIPLAPDKREKIILSVGQFRPEKNHLFQLEIFSTFLKKFPEIASEYKLVFLGSCRHEEDRNRVESLKTKSKELGIDKKHLEFVVDAPYEILVDYLSKSFIGLHCMEDEHFGICVVEYQAAGLITLAHKSAGPKMDIVTEYNGTSTGFLASTKNEYVECLNKIATLYGKLELMTIQMNARESTKRFSASSFTEKLFSILAPIGIESLKS